MRYYHITLDLVCFSLYSTEDSYKQIWLYAILTAARNFLQFYINLETSRKI